MATSYTARSKLAKPAAADRIWDVPLNANADYIDALSPIGGLVVAIKEQPSTTLNVRVGSGSYRKNNGSIGTYAGSASLAITASTTRYVYLTDNGTLTVATAYPTTPHVRLATVVAGVSTITSVTDDRVVCGTHSAGPRIGTAVLVLGTVNVSDPLVTATSVIVLTCQAEGGTTGYLRVSVRTAGTSFTILSSSVTDTSTAGYVIFEV